MSERSDSVQWVVGCEGKSTQFICCSIAFVTNLHSWRISVSRPLFTLCSLSLVSDCYYYSHSRAQRTAVIAGAARNNHSPRCNAAEPLGAIWPILPREPTFGTQMAGERWPAHAAPLVADAALRRKPLGLPLAQVKLASVPTPPNRWECQLHAHSRWLARCRDQRSKARHSGLQARPVRRRCAPTAVGRRRNGSESCPQ